MNATAKNGDAWTGERDGAWFLYRDSKRNLYLSKEVPAYRIAMNATKQMVEGKLTIVPLAKGGLL